MDEYRARGICQATVSGTLSTMRGFGGFLVRQGPWGINPLRWMNGPEVSPYNRLPKRVVREHMEALWREAASRRGDDVLLRRQATDESVDSGAAAAKIAWLQSWIDSLPPSPPIPLEATRRDSMYD